jgi:hypothetical protein
VKLQALAAGGPLGGCWWGAWRAATFAASRPPLQRHPVRASTGGPAPSQGLRGDLYRVLIWAVAPVGLTGPRGPQEPAERVRAESFRPACQHFSCNPRANCACCARTHSGRPGSGPGGQSPRQPISCNATRC